MVGDVHHWRDQPFYAIPKQLQWQFLESLGEDKFVMQLGALHIRDRCSLMIPNLMVALSLHSMTTTSGSHGSASIITTFFVFELMRHAYLVANSYRNPC